MPQTTELPKVTLRALMGGALRRVRTEQGRTLREVAASAKVSMGYLSEVERGQKEVSSELLTSVCQALRLPISSLLADMAFEAARLEGHVTYRERIPAAV